MFTYYFGSGFMGGGFDYVYCLLFTLIYFGRRRFVCIAWFYGGFMVFVMFYVGGFVGVFVSFLMII